MANSVQLLSRYLLHLPYRELMTAPCSLASGNSFHFGDTSSLASSTNILPNQYLCTTLTPRPLQCGWSSKVAAGIHQFPPLKEMKRCAKLRTPYHPRTNIWAMLWLATYLVETVSPQQTTLSLMAVPTGAAPLSAHTLHQRRDQSSTETMTLQQVATHSNACSHRSTALTYP